MQRLRNVNAQLKWGKGKVVAAAIYNLEKVITLNLYYGAVCSAL